MELMERIAAYNALLDRKAQLADETTENNKAIEQARRDLADLMIDAAGIRLRCLRRPRSASAEVRTNSSSRCCERTVSVTSSGKR